MDPKLVFCHFLKFGPLVFLKIAQDDSLEQCLATSRGKTHEKKIRGSQTGSEIRVFFHFLKVASLYFLDIAQDCSLGQCLTSSRAETSKKEFVAEIGAEMMFSILMSSSVHSNLLVYLGIKFYSINVGKALSIS